MKIIDVKTLKDLTNEAQKVDRKRKNLNFHFVNEDPIQRMLNAFEPKTYVRPHRHINPDKREVFVILTGKLLVLFFNEKGEITKHLELSRESGVYGVEIEPGEWHTATGLEEGTVVYEIKDGPYDQLNDKNFAPWAPLESDLNTNHVVERWLSTLDISI